MKAKSKSATVGKYLAKRLEQAGVRHIFGVPGDYVLTFFDCLEESEIHVIGNCNELNAGYAADAYARINGVGAVCVTYGVGGFSLLNAVAGAYAERVPLIAISGSPSVSEHKYRHLLHHTIGDMQLQYMIYEKITAASCILMNPEQAPQQIDEVISACLRDRRPVYIEIPFDIVTKPCVPAGDFSVDTSIISNKDALSEAVLEASSMLKKAKKPAILAGIEAHRLGARKELLEFVNHTGFPFATTLLGKTVITEEHSQFRGVYNGAIGTELTRRTIEEADVILCLGALMTDMNLGVGTARLDVSRMINVNSDNVKIKYHVYNHVGLKDFINGLLVKLPKSETKVLKDKSPFAEVLRKKYEPVLDRKISLKRLYERMNHFIKKGHIVAADTGDSILNAANLFLPKGVDFIGQAFYLSIGFGIPAALGIGLADSERRPVVFVGDGAFQMTAQELSTIIRCGLNPIVILSNNDGYTIERMIRDGKYNDLQMWKYSSLPEVFNGAKGFVVKTEGDLEKALLAAREKEDSLVFIEVFLDKYDCSENLKRLGECLHKKGE